MPNSTSAVLSPLTSAMADGRKANRSIRPRAERRSPAGPATASRRAGMADHAPQPRGVFQREGDHCHDFDGRQQPAELRLDRGLRGEDRRQHVGGDDGDDEPGKVRAARMRQVIALEQLVKTVPQLPGRCDCACPEPWSRQCLSVRRRPSLLRSPTARRLPWRRRGRRPAPCRAGRRRPCRRGLPGPCAPARPR